MELGAEARRRSACFLVATFFALRPLMRTGTGAVFGGWTGREMNREGAGKVAWGEVVWCRDNLEVINVASRRVKPVLRGYHGNATSTTIGQSEHIEPCF